MSDERRGHPHVREVMTIGELSRRTGVPIKNLRSYTDDGLIYTVGRSSANYRLFDIDALWCVRWIRLLRGLGLTVAEIRDLAHAATARSGRGFGPELGARLHVSRRRLHTRIAELQQVLDRIDQFETSYKDGLSHGTESCWDDDPRCPTRA